MLKTEKMTREILFKARVKNPQPITIEGKYIQGQWVEGSLITWPSGMCDIAVKISNIEMDIVNVDPATVCQYTGLNDKGGNKIWEGDKVEFIDAINNSTESGDNWEDELCVGKIYWDAECGRWECTDRLSIEIDQFIEETTTNTKVIGSIHD